MNPQCKNIVKNIKVECVETFESKPPTFWERHSRIGHIFLLGFRNLTYGKYMTIAGDTIEELEKITNEIKEHYQKECPNCDVIILEDYTY